MAAKGWIKNIHLSTIPFTHLNKYKIVDLTAAKLCNRERDNTVLKRDVHMRIGRKTVAECIRLIDKVSS